MKLSSLFLAAIFAVATMAVFLVGLGVNFRPPLPAQGATPYDPANEDLVKGLVAEVKEFACPISEGEMGSHLMLSTAKGGVTAHLAPGASCVVRK